MLLLLVGFVIVIVVKELSLLFKISPNIASFVPSDCGRCFVAVM
jgi:hypothetical protein